MNLADSVKELQARHRQREINKYALTHMASGFAAGAEYLLPSFDEPSRRRLKRALKALMTAIKKAE